MTHLKMVNTRSVLAVLLVIPTVLLAGCLTDPAHPDLSVERFDYVAYLSGGTRAVSGTITLEVGLDRSITGTWATILERTEIDPNAVGPQVGEGTMVGSIDRDGGFSVDLNPEYADNNVILSGTWDGRKIRGRWLHVGIAGTITSGAFQMDPTDLTGTPR